MCLSVYCSSFSTTVTVFIRVWTPLPILISCKLCPPRARMVDSPAFRMVRFYASKLLLCWQPSASDGSKLGTAPNMLTGVVSPVYVEPIAIPNESFSQ